MQMPSGFLKVFASIATFMTIMMLGLIAVAKGAYVLACKLIETGLSPFLSQFITLAIIIAAMSAALAFAISKYGEQK